MQNPHGLLGTLTRSLSEPHHLRPPAGVTLPSPQAARGRPRAGLAVTSSGCSGEESGLPRFAEGLLTQSPAGTTPAPCTASPVSL